MANRCFSKSLLYALRNEIDVRMLIEKTLCIPCRVSQGCFRFQCPLCGGYNTSVDPKTNLARCFVCEKNFNTIDLVMLIRQTDFVRSVKFLQPLLKKDFSNPVPDVHTMISGSNPHDHCRVERRTLSGKSNRDPCHIGKILTSVLPPEDDGILEKRDAGYKPDEDRIMKLERKLENLGRQIQQLTIIINNGLPSK